MGMVKEMVSVITPCYNGEKYISETIESVISQTYDNWEMIIIDDGSKDNSAKVVEKYLKEDPRIRLIQQENAGSAAARNRGIKECTGQYIALLDADDVWLPEFLEKQISFMKQKKAYCVACGYGRIDENSQPILHTIIPPAVITRKSMEIMNRIGCLTGLYDRRVHGKVFLREEFGSIRDDYAYWMDIINLVGRGYGNPEVLANYRVLNGSTTGNKKKLIKKQYVFQRKFLKKNPIMAAINVGRWGVAGLKKYSKAK